MRCLICFAVLAVIATLANGSPVAEDYPAVPEVDQAEALLSADGQGHENVGDREARQFGFGRYRGGYGGYGGFGGYRGGYGGFGGYRGGYGGFGGYRGGYGGYGGYRRGYGGFFG